MEQARGFEAIFFDMDGLLVDTEGLYFESSKKVFGEVGIELTREWMIHEHLAKGASTFDLARERGMNEDEVDALRQRRRRVYMTLIEKNLTIVDGVPETIATLHEHFQLAVVTGSRREEVEAVMRLTNLGHFFDFFITGSDVPRMKPNPEPYLMALERSAKKPEHCLVLEDSGNGTTAAKSAGLTCYAIPDELTKTHDFSHADKVLTSIREVPALLGIV